MVYVSLVSECVNVIVCVRSTDVHNPVRMGFYVHVKLLLLNLIPKL